MRSGHRVLGRHIGRKDLLLAMPLGAPTLGVLRPIKPHDVHELLVLRLALEMPKPHNSGWPIVLVLFLLLCILHVAAIP